MKRSIALIAGVTLASGLALAGEHGDKAKKFDEIDANGDGVVTQAEFVQEMDGEARQEHFAKADTDQNGYLSKQEYEDITDKKREYAEEAE
jgi:hypothetical protein